MKININDLVKVKLTGYGRRLHRIHHEETVAPIRAKGIRPPEYVAPSEDQDGWSVWQLWVLMETFGPFLHLGGDQPFGAEIEILKGEDNHAV